METIQATSLNPHSLRVLDHALRNQLVGILGSASLLFYEKLTPKQQEHVQNIRSSGEQLLSIATQFIQEQQPCSSVPKEPHISVLLVEDDPIISLVNSRMLAKIGCHVDIAMDAYKAIKMAAKPYDVIFMDIGLPGMSGTEATAEIRRREGNEKHTPIIALTAYNPEEVMGECLAVGMDEVANKPIKQEALEKLVQKFVAKAK